MSGFMDTISLAGSLVLAIPAAFAGIDFVSRGETALGATLIVLSILLVVAQHYVTLPSDIPGMLAKRAVGTVAKESGEDGEERSTDSNKTKTETK